MPNSNSLPINSLDFDEIKSNFIEFLKTQSFYNDYNFEGSGITTIINLLAYNTHYIGYYVKMLLNESFIDSAVLRESLLSKAKLNGYVPKGYRSSRTSVIIKTSIPIEQDNPSKTLVILQGSHCLGANISDDKRKYFILDSHVCYERVQNGSSVTYISPEIFVYEGEYSTWKFKRDTTVLNQRFIIRDSKIDIDTIKVRVFNDNSSSDFQEYTLAKTVYDVSPESKVFYLTTNEESMYEIFFGNNKFGADVNHNARIEVHYISTNGPSGDGCNSFTFVPEGEDISGRTHEVILSGGTTQGGSLPETVEDLRFNIPTNHRRQNRLVVEEDYRSLLLNEFRNIDSMNVWGGEKNTKKNYNSIYLSIKPKNGLSLSSSAKTEIINILEKYQVIGKRIFLVDPEYININADITVTYDPNLSVRSKNDLQLIIHNKINTFNENVLNRFSRDYSEVSFLNYLKDGLQEVNSLYGEYILWKTYTFDPTLSSEHTIQFGNKIRSGSVYSEQFTFDNKTCIIKEFSGKLYVVDAETNSIIPTKQIGSVNSKTGDVSVFLDFGLLTKETDDEFYIIKFYMKPQVPDINTYLNNILSIYSSRVVLVEKTSS